MTPSDRSLQRERVKLKEMTSGRHSYWPIPMLIGELNQHLRGWANYFRFGYPSQAFARINQYVQVRLWQHLKRRSQRPYRRRPRARRGPAAGPAPLGPGPPPPGRPAQPVTG